MAYTYDDFMSAAGSSGLMGEFSRYDLDTAKKYPEFGLSILSLKQDYHKAKTPEQKLLINEAANELRKSYGNYAGGPQGSDYVSEGKIPTRIDEVLDQIGSFGDFSYDVEAPTYTNRYEEQQQALLDAILNREDFSWSKETDPQWSSYKKSYLREGDRATQNAMAQASAQSGGRPSTFAMTAASQAGDYYAGKLNDIIPTLYQQAYDKYLNEYKMMQQDLGAVNTQEQMDYQKYLDSLGQFNTDRNFAYNQYLDDFNRLQSELTALQSQDAVDYGRYLDQITMQQQQRQEQIDKATLAAGYGDYSFLNQLGIDTSRNPTDFERKYNLALLGAQYGDYSGLKELGINASRMAPSSGGSRGSSGSVTGKTQGTGGNGASGLINAFRSGDHSDATIAGLLQAGYTREDIEAAGYTGDYFGKKPGGGKDAGSGKGGGDYGLEDLNTSAVLALGLGPISFKSVEDLVEQGKVEVFTDKNGRVSVRWKGGYNAKNYKGNSGRTGLVPGLSLPGLGQ